jgi:two-component system OmpR family response regulator
MIFGLLHYVERESIVMSGAATIIIARDDLSILGAEDSAADTPAGDVAPNAFFDVIQARDPDVIVLDCRGPTRDGVSAIQQVRERTQIPILVVCEANDARQRDYCITGAADCLPAPFDIVQFNRTIQQIIRLTRPAADRPSAQAKAFELAGLIYRPYQNLVSDQHSTIRLTTAENQLLLHLVMRPWRVCGRGEIAEVIYGSHRPSNDRAIDLVITRLRRKLSLLLGAAGLTLIKTEFRRGYMFASDVTTARDAAA